MAPTVAATIVEARLVLMPGCYHRLGAGTGRHATIAIIMTVGVMGAGAVGCYFGAQLARAGVPVTLVARQAHAEAITRDGLDIDSVTGRARVPMAASTSVEALAGCDVLLVCVKTPDTEATAVELARVMPPGALIVSLQNGVDNAWRIRERVPNPVVPAVVYVSVEMLGPGRLRHNGGGRLIVGEPLIDEGRATNRSAAARRADRDARRSRRPVHLVRRRAGGYLDEARHQLRLQRSFGPDPTPLSPHRHP